MLRVRPNSSVDQAKSYFAKPDYYLGDGEQEHKGQWRGKAARMLGLSGEVKEADWLRACDNINPQTGEQAADPPEVQPDRWL